MYAEDSLTYLVFCTSLLIKSTFRRKWIPKRPQKREISTELSKEVIFPLITAENLAHNK